MKLDLAVAEEVAKLKAKGYLVQVTRGIRFDPLVEDLGNDILIGDQGLEVKTTTVLLTEGYNTMNYGIPEYDSHDNIVVFKRRALCATTDRQTAHNGFIRSNAPTMQEQKNHYGLTACWFMSSMNYFVRIHPYLPPHTKNVERTSDTPKEKGRA